MKNFTFYDSERNISNSFKRWRILLSVGLMLCLGQVGFAFLLADSKSNSENAFTSTEAQIQAEDPGSNTAFANANNDDPAACLQISSSTSNAVGYSIGGDTNQSLAGDFIVYEGITFNIEEVKVSVNSASPSYFNVIFWSDNAGLPDTVLYTLNNVTIVSSTPTSGGYYLTTLDISSENISLTSPVGDTRYWMQIQTDATGWEHRAGTQLGTQDAFFNTNSAGVWTTINADTGNNDLVYEIIGECVGACIPPTAPVVTVNSLTTATLSWVSDGDLFDVEWGLPGFVLGTGNQINGITTTSTDLTVAAETPYEYYIRQDCGVDGESSWIGPFSFQTGYCIASSTNISDVITSFETTGGILNISNNTGTTISPGGYGNFTNLSVAHYETGTINFTTNFSATMGFNIWVDWNNNGTFEESEKVYASGITGNPFSGSFEVPADTPLGDYRMRVRAQWGDSNPLPCGNISWGEAEDYTLTVIDPPACLPPSGLTATPTSLTEVTLGWTSAGNNFDLEWGPSGFTPGNGTQINDIATNSTSVTVTIDTPYQFYVRQDCGVDGESLWAGPFNFKTGYCIPIYTWGCSNGAKITIFETADAILNINNETGTTSCGVGGYNNFSSLSAAAPEEMIVSFTVGIGSYNAGVKVWIDWNANGVFEASELVSESAARIATGGSYTGNFTVPTGTPLGDYRIRVRAVESTTTFDACSLQSYGETEDYTFTVITPPTCLPPTQLGANINSLTEAELYWTSDGTLFEVEYGVQGFTLGTGTSVTGITTNDTTISGLTQNTYHHYYVRRDCGGGDLSVWAGPYTFYTNYCESTTQWEWDYINGFETSGAITNISNNNTGFSFPNGYGDYTSMSVSHFETGEVSFIVETPSWLGVNIWVDWNNNMIFEESEKVYTSGNFTNPGPFTGTFSVPVGQPLGDFRMRVRGSNDSGNPSPCGMINYGETEDYTFTVIPTPTCMPPTQLGANINSLTEAELYWTSVGTLFEVEYGVQDFTLGTGTTVTGITTNDTTLSGLTPNTYHHYYVRRDCGGGDLSPWTGPYTFYTNYCEATTQWEWDYINGFETSGAITNISNNNTGFSFPNGYGDYTAMSASHFETGEVSFTLTTPSWLGVNIWVDWNNNMIFEESEKVYASGEWTMQGPFTGMFSVPVGQALGDFRMRVRGSYDSGNPSPCGQINYGETEDYTFTVIPTPTCMPPTQLGANINSLTEAELYWTSDGTLFEVEYGMQDFTLGTGTTVTGITTNNTTLSGLTPNTYHHYFIRRDCGGGDLSPWTGPFLFYTNYCESTSVYSGDNITSFVTTGGLPFDISNTNSGFSPNGYGDFTSMSVSHYETGSVDFTVTTNWSMNISIWVDWNNNMVFETNEKAFGSTATTATHTGSIVVPFGTPEGDYRIRVRAQWESPLPCGTINYGETEDYTFTVITPPTCLPPFTPEAANISASSVSLSWQADGTLFDIEYGPAGFTPGDRKS